MKIFALLVFGLAITALGIAAIVWAASYLLNMDYAGLTQAIIGIGVR